MIRGVDPMRGTFDTALDRAVSRMPLDHVPIPKSVAQISRIAWRAGFVAGFGAGLGLAGAALFLLILRWLL